MHIDHLVDRPTRKLSSRLTQSGERHVAAKSYQQNTGSVLNADADEKQAHLVAHFDLAEPQQNRARAAG
jgi:hypothetical protein